MNKVPIEYFLNFIEKATGWDDFLESKDIGDIERKLSMVPREPRSSTPIPLVNPLYRFRTKEEYKDKSSKI